jgi:membrane protein DedA with SNARE-associated domain
MDTLYQPVAEFIARHHTWAGLVLGGVSLLESIILLGAFVPATTMLIMAGGLIAAGVLEPLPVVIYCVIGTVIGDSISFLIGRRLGQGALRRPGMAPHRRKMARTRLFFRRFGPASIFIGHFFGPLRAFVPMAAGMLRMKPRTFQLANSAASVVWVLAVLAPGYFAAKGLARIEAMGEADPLTIVAVVAAALVLAGVAVWRTFQARIARGAELTLLAAQRAVSR